MMGSIDHDDLIQILEIVGQSDIDEFRLELGELKLFLKKSSAAHADRASGMPVPERTETASLTEKSEPPEERTTSSGASGKVLPETGGETDSPESAKVTGYTAIKAPLLGTFYRAPKPGAPPFVTEGQSVTEDDTLCIIEVMKLFNTVKAGIKGTIKEICAEDGQLVEFDQTLFWVEENPKQELGEAQA